MIANFRRTVAGARRLALAFVAGALLLAGAPLQDVREIDGAVETLYVMPLRRGLHGFRDVALLSDDLFPNTHPDTETRIDRIYDAADATAN